MSRRLAGSEVGAALVAVLVARTAVNGGYRIAYPFLPEIARGLGVSLAAAGGLLALRAAAGLVAPVVPRIAESIGRRAVMLAGVAATVVGCTLLATAPGLALSAVGPAGAWSGLSLPAPGLVLAAAGFAALGLAKPLFDIPMQGWFGSRVPYGRRGRVLGATELTWAVSLALALPGGVLIAATDWRAPFLLVLVLAAAGVAAVLALIASDRPARPRRRPLPRTRPVLAILVVVVLFRLAAELLFVVYGAWLEADFGMTVTAIGAFTMIVVAAELAGEGAVTAFADRIGLKRSILAGLLGSALVYASLGLVGGSLGWAVVAVVGWFALFEVTIVATVPLVTEIAGEARDRLLSLMAAVAVGSGGVAALAAPRLFAIGGIGLCGLVAAACVSAAAALLAAAVPAPAAGRATGR